MIGSARAVFFALFIVACGPSGVRHNGGDDDTSVDAAPPACTPGATQACYTGAPGTAGVGPCTGGTQTCDSGGNWGACDGEVDPEGRGLRQRRRRQLQRHGRRGRRCRRRRLHDVRRRLLRRDADGCGDPKLVNPGAFEAPGNMVDDDCDGMVDNARRGRVRHGPREQLEQRARLRKGDRAVPDRDDDRHEVGRDQRALRAAERLRHTERGPALDSSRVRRHDACRAAARSPCSRRATRRRRPDEPALSPRSSTAGSSRHLERAARRLARREQQQLPNAPGCPAPIGGTTAQRSDHARAARSARRRTRSRSSSSTNFFSSEYPEWTCSAFNDFFVVLLDSAWTGQPANPTDKNLAFYTSPDEHERIRSA